MGWGVRGTEDDPCLHVAEEINQDGALAVLPPRAGSPYFSRFARYKVMRFLKKQKKTTTMRYDGYVES